MRFAWMKPLNSLRLKVLLAYVVGVVLSITLLVVAAVICLQSNILAQMDLADAAEELAEKVRFDPNGQPLGFDSTVDDLAWLYEGPQRETAYRVLDDTGNVVLVSTAGAEFWPPDREPMPPVRGTFELEHQGMVIFGATEPLQHGGRTWYLQFAATARFMDVLHSVALPLVVHGITLFSLVLFFTFGLCTYIVLRYTLKPLRDVSESAAAISPRSLHARLKTAGVPSEIAPLVDSFNRVLERVEQGYRVQQEFLGNAAHELKTPLALIRAQIELREDRGNDRDALLSDVEYMTRQVQQLLLLAEASEAHNYRFAVFRPGETAHEAASYLQRMAESAQVHLAVATAGDGVSWTGDRGAFFTLLKNLIENAIQHAPAGSSISIDIRHDEVTVRDLGPGVDAAQLPLLFERFWRAAHRRDRGAGLGLAICREIALAHGWQLAAEQAQPGLRFRVSNTTPAAAAS